MPSPWDTGPEARAGGRPSTAIDGRAQRADSGTDVMELFSSLSKRRRRSSSSSMQKLESAESAIEKGTRVDSVKRQGEETKEKDAEIKKRDEEIEKKDAEIKKRGEEIEKKDAEIEKKDAGLEKLRAQLEALGTTGLTSELLHWDPAVQRRGLGDAVQRCNHIALIVADVGRSTTFYSEVIGLQQITRPDFDRFGAWFTLGNIELHLIKGVPLVHSGADLIVGHISLECSDMRAVVEGLMRLGIPFEQNISVPAGAGKAASQGGDMRNTMVQYFVRDPDGYYLEFCNCDILTDFCLQHHSVLGKHAHVVGIDLSEYEEAGCNTKLASTLVRAMHKIDRWLARARQRLDMAERASAVLELSRSECPPVDEGKLANLKRRQLIYCDICQSFSGEELEETLRAVSNDVPKAVLLLHRRIREGHRRTAQPPGYYKTKRQASSIRRGSVEFYTPPRLELPHKPSPPGESLSGSSSLGGVKQLVSAWEAHAGAWAAYTAHRGE